MHNPGHMLALWEAPRPLGWRLSVSLSFSLLPPMQRQLGGVNPMDVMTVVTAAIRLLTWRRMSRGVEWMSCGMCVWCVLQMGLLGPP